MTTDRTTPSIDTPAGSEAWPFWVVADIEGRLHRLRSLLEAHQGPASTVQFDPRSVGQPYLVPSMDGDTPSRPSSFAVLERLFGLSPFEEDVLALALAAEVDPSFGPVFAATDGVGRRGYPTPNLALDLFAETLADRLIARRSFNPGNPLVRYRLIQLDDPGVAGATAGEAVLRLEPRVADFVLGVNRPDDTFRRITERIEPGPLWSRHRTLLERTTDLLLPLLARHPRPVLNLVGSRGSGRHVLAEALSASLGLELLELDPSGLPTDPADREAILRIVDREAILSAAAIYLDWTDPVEDRAALADVLRGRECLVIAAGRSPLDASLRDLVVEVPQPDAVANVERWRTELGPVRPAEDPTTDLVEQFAFGPREIQRAAAAARDRAAAAGRPLAAGDLQLACRRQAASDLDDLARRLEPCHDWDDIVLPPDLTAHLREIAGQVSRRFEVYERWGFGVKLARGRGITGLFAGPSGTGKTTAAEVIANHLRLDLYRIDLASVVSKYIGETEKNLRRLFDAAERTGAVLLFDEADALFGKRSEVKDSHDRYANIEINYLLQRMEDYRGLAILATNMRGLLDHAFVRRLRFILDFPFPDRALRREIWSKVFPPEAAAVIDPEALSRLEVTGGTIKAIAVNAAFMAAEGGMPIGMDHVWRAARREYRKIDKLVVESEFDPRRGAAA